MDEGPDEATWLHDMESKSTELPFRFRSPQAEARARAEEFRRLSSDERWQTIVSLMQLGLNLARSSPRRAAIEARWAAEEAQWQRLQQQFFAQHGQ